MATVCLLGLMTMVLGLATAGPVPPSKPTPAGTGCHFGSFHTLSQWELDAFKKDKEALVCHCYHNGPPYIITTGIKIVAYHCGLAPNLLL